MKKRIYDIELINDFENLVITIASETCNFEVFLDEVNSVYDFDSMKIIISIVNSETPFFGLLINFKNGLLNQKCSIKSIFNNKSGEIDPIVFFEGSINDMIEEFPLIGRNIEKELRKYLKTEADFIQTCLE